MKYFGMPAGMGMLFSGSFRDKLTTVLGFSKEEAAEITKRANEKYKKIIAKLPEFEKEDRFTMNIVNCAMFSAFVLNMPERPAVEQITDYFAAAMMIRPMKWFCRRGGKKKFTREGIEGMKQTAAFRAADRNPYSWNMDFYPYPDNSGYELRFTKCGICTLMRELGLGEYIPAMCHLDYTMSEAGGAADFIRKYTLAAGDPYCDNGYKRKEKRI